MNHKTIAYDSDFAVEARRQLQINEINLIVAGRRQSVWGSRLKLIPASGERLQLWFANQRVIDVAGAVRAALTVLPATAGALDELALDIAKLHQGFVQLSEDEKPFLSLRVIDEAYYESNKTSVSSHFHRDAACLTLFCTYAGLGTQWTPNENVRRQYFAMRQKQTYDVGDDTVVYNPTAVYTTPTFAVGILKGELSPDEPDAEARWFIGNFRPVETLPYFNVGRGLIHRGPARAAREPRLVLTLSSFVVPAFLSESSSEPW